jgi:hypothetical protein
MKLSIRISKVWVPAGRSRAAAHSGGRWGHVQGARMAQDGSAVEPRLPGEVCKVRGRASPSAGVAIRPWWKPRRPE